MSNGIHQSRGTLQMLSRLGLTIGSLVKPAYSTVPPIDVIGTSLPSFPVSVFFNDEDFVDWAEKQNKILPECNAYFSFSELPLHE